MPGLCTLQYTTKCDACGSHDIAGKVSGSGGNHNSLVQRMSKYAGESAATVAELNG